MISVKNYGEKTKYFSPLVFFYLELVAILVFRALTKLHIFDTIRSAMKSYTREL